MCTINSFYIIDAPIDCEWTNWEIGSCSKECEGGTRTNTRVKKVTDSNGGNCDGESTVQESCNEQDCPGMLNALQSFPRIVLHDDHSIKPHRITLK